MKEIRLEKVIKGILGSQNKTFSGEKNSGRLSGQKECPLFIQVSTILLVDTEGPEKKIFFSQILLGFGEQK